MLLLPKLGVDGLFLSMFSCSRGVVREVEREGAEARLMQLQCMYFQQKMYLRFQVLDLQKMPHIDGYIAELKALRALHRTILRDERKNHTCWCNHSMEVHVNEKKR